MLGDSDEDDSDLEAELPPVSDSRHAHTFRYRCVHKLRGWILRWRMLRGSMKALVCVFLCIAIAIATSIGIIATELVSSGAQKALRVLSLFVRRSNSRAPL